MQIRVAAAASAPQFTPSKVMKLNTATGTVRVLSPAKMSAKVKLFQEKMKLRIAAATMPGPVNGSAMRQNTPNQVLPSTSAASSISRGRSSKNGIMIHIVSGSVRIRWVRINAGRCPPAVSGQKQDEQVTDS